MYLEQPLDDLSAAVESTRHRLTSVDFGSAAESALAGARATAAQRWSRPKRRSRWPLVAAVLVICSVAVAAVFLDPPWRRTMLKSEDPRAPGIRPRPGSGGSAEEAIDHGDWPSLLSEEANDGEASH